jgi:hypothetical protein
MDLETTNTKLGINYSPLASIRLNYVPIAKGNNALQWTAEVEWESEDTRCNMPADQESGDRCQWRSCRVRQGSLSASSRADKTPIRYQMQQGYIPLRRRL